MSIATYHAGRTPMLPVRQDESVTAQEQVPSGMAAVPPYTSAGLSWAYDDAHIVPTAGFDRRETLIDPIRFAGARYLGVHYDKMNGKKDVTKPRLIVQTENGTFLLERRVQHRSPDDPMALRQPFGISVEPILLMNPNDLTEYRSLGGYVSRFLSNDELRGLDPLIRGKSDSAFHFQMITADAVVAELRRVDKQAEL